MSGREAISKVAQLFAAPIKDGRASTTTSSKERRDLSTASRRTAATDLNRKSLPPVRIVLPGVSDFRGRARTRTNKLIAAPEPHAEHERERRDTIRVRIPGMLKKLSSGKLNKLSKACPPLPEDDKHYDFDSKLRSTPELKPLPPIAATYSSSSSVSTYSDDSAEQTWHMINAMMNATNEEEMKKARDVMNLPEGGTAASLPRSSHESKKDARGGREAERRARSRSRPSRGASREITSAGQGAPSAFKGLSSHPIALQISHQGSTGSVFSVVIKPFKSTNGSQPLVDEDTFPPRVKRIVQDARERACFEAGLESSDEDEDAGYHTDVAAVLETLHSCLEVNSIGEEYDWDSDY